MRLIEHARTIRNRKPRPLVTTNVFWRHAAQFATVGIFLIMFGAFSCCEARWRRV